MRYQASLAIGLLTLLSNVSAHPQKRHKSCKHKGEPHMHSGDAQDFYEEHEGGHGRGVASIGSHRPSYAPQISGHAHVGNGGQSSLPHVPGVSEVPHVPGHEVSHGAVISVTASVPEHLPSLISSVVISHGRFASDLPSSSLVVPSVSMPSHDAPQSIVSSVHSPSEAPSSIVSSHHVEITSFASSHVSVASYASSAPASSSSTVPPSPVTPPHDFCPVGTTFVWQESSITNPKTSSYASLVLHQYGYRFEFGSTDINEAVHVQFFQDEATGCTLTLPAVPGSRLYLLRSQSGTGPYFESNTVFAVVPEHITPDIGEAKALSCQWTIENKASCSDEGDNDVLSPNMGDFLQLSPISSAGPTIANLVEINPAAQPSPALPAIHQSCPTDQDFILQVHLGGQDYYAVAGTATNGGKSYPFSFTSTTQSSVQIFRFVYRQVFGCGLWFPQQVDNWFLYMAQDDNDAGVEQYAPAIAAPQEYMPFAQGTTFVPFRCFMTSTGTLDCNTLVAPGQAQHAIMAPRLGGDMTMVASLSSLLKGSIRVVPAGN